MIKMTTVNWCVVGDWASLSPWNIFWCSQNSSLLLILKSLVPFLHLCIICGWVFYSCTGELSSNSARLALSYGFSSCAYGVSASERTRARTDRWNVTTIRRITHTCDRNLYIIAKDETELFIMKHCNVLHWGKKKTFLVGFNYYNCKYFTYLWIILNWHLKISDFY